MKKLIIVALMTLAGTASATPYFRLMDPASPYTSIGAYVDPVNSKQSSIGTSLALVTHSPKDGCLLPGITCENWTPLAVDYSANAGQALFGFGPSANLAPMVRKALAAALPYTDQFATMHDLAAALQPNEKSMINVAFGPKWMMCPQQNWKGYFRIASGVSWNW